MALAIAASTGCGPGAGWVLSYGDGERLASARQDDLLVFYKNPLDPESGNMGDVLNQPQVKGLVTGKVKCLLVAEFEPNQRFVAQYGITDTPALIVIHPDGTYHARQGMTTASEVVAFLQSAVGPGSKAELNPLLPRTYDYHWEGVYEDALEQARKQNRPLLIVYKWWLSPESTELLRRLSRPETARHFADMVHCLLDWDYVPNRRHMAKYGVQKVPAMVIVHRDGTFHAKVGLPEIPEIVRFVVNAKPPGRVPGWQARTMSQTQYDWETDFQSALASAGRQQKNLFVFYFSVFSDESNSMEQLLGSDHVAGLFSSPVNCKLDWANPGNRQIMAAYGVDRVPAFVMIRPDGTYHARVGKLAPADLEGLVRDAREPGLRPIRRSAGS